jgi:hypothetical protein
MQAAAGTSTIVLDGAAILAEDSTFTICYAERPNETEWRNSFVYARLTKLRTLMAHSVSHTTSGHIANVGGHYLAWDGSQYLTTDVVPLQLTFAGSLLSDSWVSLVDATIHANFPCANSSEASATADGLHSGAVQGYSSVVAYDTTELDTTKTFAVCYTEGDGTAAATWVDAAIRLTISKVETLLYGPSSSSFPVRTMRSTNVMAATNRLPQVAGVVVTYTGDLELTSGYHWSTPL